MHRRDRTYPPAGLLSVLLVFILACAGCGTLPGPGPVVGVTATPEPLPQAAQIDAYLSHLATEGSLSGAVLVAHNGMVFSKGYGLADKETGVPNTPRTMFRIGSVTKQFTAMAILILQERGKLHVQDHICLYVPACPQDWQPITIQQLLTHSSGIPDYINVPNFTDFWTQPETPDQLVARFKNLPLEFLPGSAFRYSNSGYTLLGYIIERITGETYATFLQQNIFTPLKMLHSGYDTTQLRAGHAIGYYRGYVKPAAYDTSVLYAAGALYSSVEDLYTWDQAFMRPRLVTQQTVDNILSIQIACSMPGKQNGCEIPTELGYGYGWRIAAEARGRLIFHVGHIDGYFAYNGFYPADHLVIVVLSNLETTDVLGIGLKLASLR